MQWKQPILDDDNVDRVERTVITERCFFVLVKEEEKLPWNSQLPLPNKIQSQNINYVDN